MNATNKLLDKFLKTCVTGMDKEIAEKLRVKHSAVSNWRHERAHPDAESVEKMAIAIGEPVAPWLMLIEAERARTAEGKRVWLRHAAALGITTALVIALLPSRVHAGVAHSARVTGSAQFDISQNLNRHSRVFADGNQVRPGPASSSQAGALAPRYRSSVLELTLPFQGITRSWNHTTRLSESMGATFVSTEEAKCPGRKSS